MSNRVDIRKKKAYQKGTPVFSILIPTWNNLGYLTLCIESIRKNSFYSHEIIIHINEGKDGTLSWAETQPDISFTYSEKNVGVCYALNSARGLATTNYIVYINDDMYLCPQWDKLLREEIEKLDHNFFFLSSTSIEPVSSGNCVIEKNYGESIDSFDEKKLLDEYQDLSKDDWQGSTWPPNIVHKDLWDLVGGYSTEFSPGMYSDPDFSLKLWKAGVRLFKGIGKSRAYHFGSRSVSRIKKNKGYYTFIAKWGMTSSTFTKLYLRRGEIFDGELKTPDIGLMIQLKNFFKRIWVAFRNVRL